MAKHHFQPKRFVVYRGRRMSLSQACRDYGEVDVQVAFIRIFRCRWTVEDAIETPKNGIAAGGSGSKSRNRIDDNKLRELWPTRMSSKRLPHEMGNARSALYRRAQKLGLLTRRLIWARQKGYGAQPAASGTAEA